MDYLHESAGSIYRRRRRRRRGATMWCVIVLLFGTVIYAASYVQGWVGTTATKAVASTSCNRATASQVLAPPGVTLNVYNSTARAGLAGLAAGSLQSQGFKIATIDNDPLGKTILGIAEIRHGQFGLDGAILAGLRLPGATLVLDARMDASVDVVIGKAFKAVKDPPKIAVLPKPKPTPYC